MMESARTSRTLSFPRVNVTIRTCQRNDVNTPLIGEGRPSPPTPSESHWANKELCYSHDMEDPTGRESDEMPVKD